MILTGTPHGVSPIVPGDRVKAALINNKNQEEICSMQLDVEDRARMQF